MPHGGGDASCEAVSHIWDDTGTEKKQNSLAQGGVQEVTKQETGTGVWGGLWPKSITSPTYYQKILSVWGSIGLDEGGGIGLDPNFSLDPKETVTPVDI